MANSVRIPQPISAGLMLSYQCTAECRHCMYACSPKWKGWMSEGDLETVLKLLADKIMPSPFGENHVSLNHGLHITGGEPFLNFKLLLKAVSLAQQLDIPSTFVETNCYWCLDDHVTREKLGLLKEKGLIGILISVNPFYLEYIPFERTERCAKLAQEIFGENVMIYQLEYYDRFQQLKITGTRSLGNYLKSNRDDLTRHVELFLMGRAVYQLEHLYHKYPPQFFYNELCQPSFLRNWHNHFDNYGNFIPGYCGGISLGDWHNLNGLITNGPDLQNKPILELLLKSDFQGLMQFARERGYQASEEGYVSKCHLCIDIRKYLSDHGEYEEMAPREFYTHLKTG